MGPTWDTGALGDRATLDADATDRDVGFAGGTTLGVGTLTDGALTAAAANRFAILSPVARASRCDSRLYTALGVRFPFHPNDLATRSSSRSHPTTAGSTASSTNAVASEKLPILPECDEYPTGLRWVSTANFLKVSVTSLMSIGRTIFVHLDGNLQNRAGHISHRNFDANVRRHPG